MPFPQFKKTECVLYALVILFMFAPLASGQGYSDSQFFSARQSDGMVDRLSRGEISATSRPAKLSDEVRYSSPGLRQEPYEPQRRGVLDDGIGSDRLGDDTVVALRPQPMSVRQASFETGEPLRSAAHAEPIPLRTRQELDRLNAQDHYQSFIQRESGGGGEQPKADATAMITKIGINLLFVLALAVGGILCVKQIQKGKGLGKAAPRADLQGLKIDQVLQVTRGVSLYLVDSMASKILVAVDGGGIKSVNVLPSRFEDELEDPEAFSRQRESVATRSGGSESTRGGSRRGINKTSTSDIDENLIKLLLTKSKEAA